MTKDEVFVYHLVIDSQFTESQWYVVNMLMDYANNLGVSGEELLEVDGQGSNITITTREFQGGDD